ncbi:lysophospholipid acyltransferase family protein [Clostridium neuense]|uniref:Lysophospholipid acyltransferase family protein n=1 Tax=Clostridium neuense TaxID=1728934 RepID=A0ABW8TFK8_9CLOT
MLSPKLARIIEIFPASFAGYIGKKILNSYLNKYANISVQGIDELKKVQKPIIFICNHLSNSDGLVLNKILNVSDDFDVTFVAGVKLKHDAITQLGTYCVKTTPIKPNTADKEGLSKIIKILKSNHNILIFPEGTRSRTGAMIEATKGLALIAKLSKAIIVPIGIHGSEKLLPINKEGNMYKEDFQHADVEVKIGKAFYLDKKYQDENRKDYEKRVVDEAMYRIAELLPEKYRGVYSKKGM